MVLCCRTLPLTSADSKSKHCQRHNGPEGWVLLTKVTSSYTNLDHIHTSLEFSFLLEIINITIVLFKVQSFSSVICIFLRPCFFAIFLNKCFKQKGVIIGPKSYKNDVYPSYFQNYWPKPKKLNTSTPKPQTRDIGEPFYGNGPTESPK